MKEVTPDAGVFKSSVFHRLLQRAFPGWFPYNSIRFFHPFYTAQKNSEFAKDQGYAEHFKVVAAPTEDNPNNYNCTDSEATKPVKPMTLSTFAEVKAVLCDKNGLTCNIAALDKSWLPEDVAIVLDPGYQSPNASKLEVLAVDEKMISGYFRDITREMINREAYTFDNDTFQVDATRE